DYKHRQVTHGSDYIGLSKKEFATFECLVDSSGMLVSKSNLIDFVYGVGEGVNDTTLEVLISRLRKKVSAYGIQVNMVRGLGYYLKAE
ncbi:MAG: winged helix-turn-helix domain-containing protein, partial [Alphaproteobacteria bacterium]